MFKLGLFFGGIFCVLGLNPFNTINNTKSVNDTISSFSLKSCGNSADIAQNLFLDIDPKLPQDNYVLYLNSDISKDITGGLSQYDVTYNFIPLSPSTNDLCGEIANSNITCPLQKGYIALQSNGSVPTGLSGTVVIKNQWFDETGARILCMLFSIKI
jgi:hypothetical protein